MPGESVTDAMAAAERAADAGIDAVLSRLGENVRRREDVDAAVGHYDAALAHAGGARADVQLSVKLTHLGLDIDRGLAAENLDRLARRAAQAGTAVWIDMESSAYVDRTLDAFRGALREHPNIGLCLQAYLHRSPDDLDALLGATSAIRLVKGAYAETAEVALQRRKQIDDAFHRLAVRLLTAGPATRSAHGSAREQGSAREPRNPPAAAPGPAPPAPPPVLGTHDTALIERVAREAEGAGADRAGYEIQMLYGIRGADQSRLVRAGHRVRVFICYGPEWYPWFVRRLAERPANLLMVARQVWTR